MEDLYVIKKYGVDAFKVPISIDEKDLRTQKFMGYLSEVNEYNLSYFLAFNKNFASKLTLKQAALLVAKLNKLNLLFYEIEKYE